MNPAFFQPFKDLLDDAVGELGTELEEGHDVLAAYMSERALHLSTIVGEPGFGQAVTAERNSVAMRAGLQAAAAADSVDAHLLGLIGGALRVAAVALA